MGGPLSLRHQGGAETCPAGAGGYSGSGMQFVRATAILCAAWAALPVAGSDVVFAEETAASGLAGNHQPSTGLLVTGNIIASMISGGVAGDFNNDGFQDVFFLGGGATQDRLYINNGDGTFTDQAAAWGVAVKHMGLAACAGDFDRDGLLDLFVTSGGLDGTTPAPGKHRLYRNTGQGTFVNVASSANVASVSSTMCDGMGCAFGDYDLDGDLDLFVAGWVNASNGNRLLRNNGNGTFSNGNSASGILSSLAGVHGFAPRFVDMNGDRFPELLLTGDYHTSRYWVNNGNGTYTDSSASSGTCVDDNGMGSAVGDFDGDGRLDWFVASIAAPPMPETPGTGNMLYRNLGGNAFQEVSVASGVKDGNWGWGSSAVDLDNDGDLDLVQTNGWVTQAMFQNQPTRVWINDGTGTFTDVAATCGLWHTLQGRGLITFDADNDGDQDVLIFANQGPNRFYRNLLPHGADTHWLDVRLNTAGARRLAPRGVGTRITLLAGGKTQVRVIDGGCNYLGQNELQAHFGLGGTAQVDEVRVHWNNGTVTLLSGLAADQRIQISSGERCDLDGDGAVNGRDLGALLAAWGPIDPHQPVDLNADGMVDGADLGVLFFNWAN